MVLRVASRFIPSSKLAAPVVLRPLPLVKPVYHISRLLSTTAIRMAPSNLAPFYEGEPEAPIVKTDVPGPVSKKEIDELCKVFDTRALSLLTDYQKCFGNYIADRDGNVFLDV